MRKICFVLLIVFCSCINGQNVIPLVPNNGEEITDIAVSFKVETSLAGPYVIQVSKNSNFTGEVFTQTQTMKDGRNHVFFYSLQGTMKPSMKFVFTPGTWYWRVTADGGTTYSTTRSVIVNDNKPATPLTIDISPDKPLFHCRLRSGVIDYYSNPEDAKAALKKIVPDELKDYMVLDLGQSFLHLTKGRSILEYSRFYNDLGYKFIFDMGTNGRQDRTVILAELEQVFKELPNCVGVGTTEIFYGYFNDEIQKSQWDGTLELCRKYGKVYSYADMNWKWVKWQLFNKMNFTKFMDRGLGNYLLPQYKNTDPWGAYTNVSAIQGMKLSGMVQNIGIWSDMWCWEKFGNVNQFLLEDWISQSHTSEGGQNFFPFIQHIKQYIYGMTYGSTVFSLEGNQQWHYMSAQPNDLYYRYLAPFFKAVVQEHLIPSEKAINNNFNIIVDTELTSSDPGQSERISYLEGNVWGDFLRSTYGISDLEPYNDKVTTNQGEIYQSAYLEMQPNSDRYPSGIPFLPKPGVQAPVLDGKTLSVVKISDIQSKEDADLLLNKYYPESLNEAYAQRIDSSIFVFNTLENHDVKQKYTVGIHFAGIDSLSGDIALMSYVVGRCRRDGETIFFQTNAHVKNSSLNGAKYDLPTYPSVLKFKCQLEPVVTSDKMSAITKEWDATTGILTLEINHAMAGAVNFTLTGDKTINYKVESIQLPETSIEIRKEDEVQLHGSYTPSDIHGVGIVYHSMDPTVATVSRSGLLKGIKDGETTVVASIGSVKTNLTVKVKGDVGIRDINEMNVLIYPNPVSGVLNIKGFTGISTYEIFNTLGMKVMDGTMENLNTIDVTVLNTGVYLLKVKNGDGYGKTTFVKVN